jgi:hypothetical protein
MRQESRQSDEFFVNAPGIPASVATLTGGRVWEKSDMEAWMREVGR